MAAAAPWRDLPGKYGGLYLKHPIRSLEGTDPLESFEYAGAQAKTGLGGEAERLRLGYAAFREQRPQVTLSGSARNLREEIRNIVDTVDIGVEFPSLTRMALKAVHTRHRGGRFTKSWCFSKVTDMYVSNSLRRGSKSVAAEGGPPDGVNVLGILPRDDVAKLYSMHDVFVMPSRMEPFGLVFAGALSKGIPVVERNAYAMPEVITPGVSGAPIERDDPNELAAAIAGVLAEDERAGTC